MRWRRGLPGIIADDEGGIGGIELVGPLANHAGHTVLEIRGLVAVNDEGPVIELIGDANIPVS